MSSINFSLIKKLKRLRLSGIVEILEERLKEAGEKRWSHSEFLDLLLSDEVDRREYKCALKMLSKSGLDSSKALENFDFSFNSKVNEELIRELATCTFIEKSENVFILGPSGVGKSHLAQALGHQACRKQIEVYFFRTTALVKWLHSGRGDGTSTKRIEKIIKCPLLILDDFGLQPLSAQQQDDLYEIICHRYESGSTIITSNRDVDEWISMFDNPLVGGAAVDRLVHKTTTITIEGKSYRLADYKTRNSKKREKDSK